MTNSRQGSLFWLSPPPPPGFLLLHCALGPVLQQFAGLGPASGLTSAALQVTAGSRTKHFVSYRRDEFVQMRFPKFSLPKVSSPDP